MANDPPMVADFESSLRDSGILYPFVGDQGPMNICYTYSSTEAISSLYARENSVPPMELSTQQLADHVPIVYDYEGRRHSRDDLGCYLGNHIDCFRYAMHNGLCLAIDYPKRDSRWDADVLDPVPNKSPKYRIASYNRVNTETEDEINQILDYQPMVGAIRFSRSFRNFKGEGVYMGPHQNETDPGGHSILIVGYGIQNGIKYYLIKNSAGEDWGVGGYGKVRRDLLYSLAYPVGVYEDPCYYKKKKPEDVASGSGTKKTKGSRS